jgi:hypothetical protein
MVLYLKTTVKIVFILKKHDDLSSKHFMMVYLKLDETTQMLILSGYLQFYAF